jgi:flagellar protein FlbD
MIKLTKQNGEEFYLNIDRIETIKEVPHTVISTIDDDKYLVKESAEDVVEKIVEYKRKVYNDSK